MDTEDITALVFESAGTLCARWLLRGALWLLDRVSIALYVHGSGYDVLTVRLYRRLQRVQERLDDEE